MWLLVHSRQPEVQQTFLEGRALLTALDIERWTRCIGDSFDK